MVRSCFKRFDDLERYRGFFSRYRNSTYISPQFLLRWPRLRSIVNEVLDTDQAWLRCLMFAGVTPHSSLLTPGQVCSVQTKLASLISRSSLATPAQFCWSSHLTTDKKLFHWFYFSMTELHC